MYSAKPFRPRKPLRAEKILIGKQGLNWKEWSVCGETETSLSLVNRFTGSARKSQRR